MLDTVSVKAHLRLRHSDDDAYLEGLAAAAAQAFNDQTNRTLVPVGGALPDPVGNALYLNKAIEQGMLLLIGHWYVNREAVVVGTIATEMPSATEHLWRPYRWMNVG